MAAPLMTGRGHGIPRRIELWRALWACSYSVSISYHKP